MRFRTRYSSQALKALRRLDPEVCSRVRDQVQRLQTTPFPRGIKRVEGPGKVFRVRIGDVRVLYTVNHERQEIDIAKIDKRGRVYK